MTGCSNQHLQRGAVRSVAWLACCGVSLMVSLPLLGSAAETSGPEQSLSRGMHSYKNGAFPDAALQWTNAARGFEQIGQSYEQGQALIHLSSALSQLGRYTDAETSLHQALILARNRADGAQQAVILGQLGTLHFAVGKNPEASALLHEALTHSRQLQRNDLTASFLNDLGNVLASDEQFAAAGEAYAEAAALAQESANPLLRITADINAAKVAALEGRRQEAKSRLDFAAIQARQITDSHEKAMAWLNIGLGLESLRDPVKTQTGVLYGPASGTYRGSRKVEVVPGSKSDVPALPSTSGPLSVSDDAVVQQAAESYFAAITVAGNINDAALEAYGWGYLGGLYEKAGRVNEALDLTRRAILTVQKLRAPESLYRWHWQTARLLARQGKTGEALLAYRRAVTTLQPIRPEFLAGSRSHRASFRETTGPLFFELSDLLLKEASSTTDAAVKRDLLVQAQDTVELFKAAELQDYFHDECVAVARAHSATLTESDRHTAVIYPIILKDRLELLVSLGGTLTQFVAPVTGERLTELIRAFRISLEDRSSHAYVRQGQELYTWLIKPLEQHLAQAEVTTLVFVPDGPLRTIPMAPLHDGHRFLVEQYALAVTPGMTLTDPRPINRTRVNLLSAGLSESVQGFPALPNVPKELRAINALYGGRLLLDNQFQVVQMESELKDQPFSIVHIASHGTVGHDSESSYILAYDEKITMDRLSQLVGLYQFRDSPLELLTLSACETAAGDDRAALGLAGVAIKAGARSAVATLWFIDDAATSDLVADFYRQLQNPHLSKAAALQQAQIAVLKDPSRKHPSFWAPFLLINNWL